jgi:hypothetical protein
MDRESGAFMSESTAGGFSRHARARMQQRCIPVAVVQQLLDFGTVQHDHRGALIVYFDKRSRRRLDRARGRAAARWLERWRNAYAVVAADGVVVTVGRRDKPMRRH